MKERPDNQRNPTTQPGGKTAGHGLIPQDPTTCLSATHSPRPAPHISTKQAKTQY
ncbi:hypothetical protein SAMN05421678_112219 [Actinopolymorpha cephalotaxi]|uniref:Uncharacterized protein n=1 Tax=Actinopolymorpha cephalotaxi TaxID=504797 RepID=A0A1I2XJ10_9ACTN|nr:hypothetical protein [Actinopolymorpha cephalotaxi]NYH86281.1 hypothetical protein [Actinopolymorpha cephalotaxi]SFH13392.1 hypothetical protein SAMN05421678_112219 [Actinopolymorpha cephalotaxi]